MVKMLWETWLESAALGLGTSAQQAGILISFVLSLAALIVIAVATKGRNLEIAGPLTLLLSILLFVYIGWFPSLLGSILALVMAAFIARVVI